MLHNSWELNLIRLSMWSTSCKSGKLFLTDIRRHWETTTALVVASRSLRGTSRSTNWLVLATIYNLSSPVPRMESQFIVQMRWMLAYIQKIQKLANLHLLVLRKRKQRDCIASERLIVILKMYWSLWENQMKDTQNRKANFFRHCSHSMHDKVTREWVSESAVSYRHFSIV